MSSWIYVNILSIIRLLVWEVVCHWSDCLGLTIDLRLPYYILENFGPKKKKKKKKKKRVKFISVIMLFALQFL
ncbi:hypothetical protein HanIR_Chr17g0901081 [Helianthus annuus]|nr:hypothetical protein HanIR_Chr17g0901081 [Helianthus annuus]